MSTRPSALAPSQVACTRSGLIGITSPETAMFAVSSRHEREKMYFIILSVLIKLFYEKIYVSFNFIIN